MELDKLGIEYAYHGDWVWAFGIGPNPCRRGQCKDENGNPMTGFCPACKEASEKRNAIKELGFKYKHREDHVCEDEDDPHFEMWKGRGSRWAHSCEHPQRFRSSSKRKKDDEEKEDNKPNLNERMAALSWD